MRVLSEHSHDDAPLLLRNPFWKLPAFDPAGTEGACFADQARAFEVRFRKAKLGQCVVRDDRPKFHGVEDVVQFLKPVVAGGNLALCVRVVLWVV